MTADVASLLSGVADGEPGVAIGIYREGVLASATVKGRACVEYAVPIGPRTGFDLASLAKQLTAACALQLHRDGVLDLDADARTWLPELRPPDVTLRHCLHHTSGLPDYEETSALRGDPVAALATLRHLLAWVSTVERTTFRPGSDIAYSNTGYVLVSTALSRAAGRPFAELLRDVVLDPLGMTETVVHDTVGLVVPGLAFSYLMTEDGPLRQDMPEELVGDGAVVSHLEDLAAWHGFLVDGRVLGGDLRRDLLAPAVLADGTRTRYAAGMGRYAVAGRLLLAHTGSMYGYRNALLSVPTEGLGVTVLSNRADTDARALAVDVARRCLRLPGEESPPRLPKPEGRWLCRATGEVVEGPRRQAGWLSSAGSPWCESDEPEERGSLLAEDDLGRARHFLPLVDEPPREVTIPPGRYVGAPLGPVMISRAADAVLIALGRRPPTPLHPVAANHADVYLRIAGPEPTWVTWRGAEAVLTVSTGGAVYRLEREGESA